MIDSAFTWLGQLAEWFASWFPRLLVVQSSHRAVKYVRGATPVLLAPGLHVYWPLVTPVETCAVVRQVVEVPAHLLETADRAAVVVSGVIEYEIGDALVFLAEAENGYLSLEKVAAATIRSYVLESTTDELRENDDMTRRMLTSMLQEDLQPYGVRVLGARLADCARVRPIHLTGGLRTDHPAVHFEN